jgi:hypothetical protein
MSRRKDPLPGQRPDETEAEYIARIEARVEERLRHEGQVPERFSRMSRSPTLTVEHPIFRTTNHDYGSMPVTEYERPMTYRTVSRQFTEKQHLGLNYEHGGFNLQLKQEHPR